MKIILGLLLIPTFCFSQTKLDGEYCNKAGWGVTCLTFHNDNLFEYVSSGCEYRHGKGLYKVTGDTLALHFLNNEIIPGTKVNLSALVPSGTFWWFIIKSTNRKHVTLNQQSKYDVIFTKDK